jgi:hypothetical protein
MRSSRPASSQKATQNLRSSGQNRTNLRSAVSYHWYRATPRRWAGSATAAATSGWFSSADTAVHAFAVTAVAAATSR